GASEVAEAFVVAVAGLAQKEEAAAGGEVGGDALDSGEAMGVVGVVDQDLYAPQLDQIAPPRIVLGRAAELAQAAQHGIVGKQEGGAEGEGGQGVGDVVPGGTAESE